MSQRSCYEPEDCELFFFKLSSVFVFTEAYDFLSVNVMKQDKAVLWLQLSRHGQLGKCLSVSHQRTAPLWTPEGGVLLLMSCNSCSSLAQSPQIKVIQNICDGLQKQSPAWHATLWTGEESESQAGVYWAEHALCPTPYEAGFLYFFFLMVTPQHFWMNDEGANPGEELSAWQ